VVPLPLAFSYDAFVLETVVVPLVLDTGIGIWDKVAFWYDALFLATFALEALDVAMSAFLFLPVIFILGSSMDTTVFFNCLWMWQTSNGNDSVSILFDAIVT